MIYVIKTNKALEAIGQCFNKVLINVLLHSYFVVSKIKTFLVSILTSFILFDYFVIVNKDLDRNKISGKSVS